jgi:hypothetical protein
MSTNTETKREKRRRYYSKNRKRLCEIRRKYRKDNIARMRVHARKYYETNKEKIRAQDKLRRKRNPEKVANGYARLRQKRRSEGGEKMRAMAREHYWKNRIHRLELQRQWRTKNGKDFNAYRRAKYATEPQSFRDAVKRFRDRARRLSAKYQRNLEKNAWILSRLRRMAKDDGVWDLLNQEWESEHGKRSLRQVDARLESRQRNGGQLQNGESRHLASGPN